MFWKFKRVIGWSIANIIGFPLRIFTHKIQIEIDYIPSIDHQHRLNLPMQRSYKEKDYLAVRCRHGLSNFGQ